jgi:transposase
MSDISATAENVRVYVTADYSSTSMMVAVLSLPEARYHMFFNPQTLELVLAELICTDDRGTHRFDSSAAHSTALIDEIFRIIKQYNLVEQVIQADQAKSKQRNHVRDQVREFWQAKMRKQDLPSLDGITEAEFAAESDLIADGLHGI